MARSSGEKTEIQAPASIFLVGFMGAGKTTVGRALGQRLHWIFEDLDERIERRERRTVPEIFRESGEAAFRRAEHEALRELIEELRSGSPRIVALGGGAFVQEENATLLLDSRLPVIFLDAPVEELWQRCQAQAFQQQAERPLLKVRDRFCELYEARRSGYARASLTIQTGGRDLESIATEIAEKLGLQQIAVRTELRIDLRIEKGEVE